MVLNLYSCEHSKVFKKKKEENYVEIINYLWYSIIIQEGNDDGIREYHIKGGRMWQTIWLQSNLDAGDHLKFLATHIMYGSSLSTHISEKIYTEKNNFRTVLRYTFYIKDENHIFPYPSLQYFTYFRTRGQINICYEGFT